MGKVIPLPEGYHTATPYLIIKGAAKALEFYKKAFGATEIMRMADPTGKVMHAEIKIGDSPIMIAEEFPQMGARAPQSIGGSPVSIFLYVEDVDKLSAQAIAAGAKVLMPVQDQFWGDRYGKLRDPFGHNWALSFKAKMTKQEMERKRQAVMAAFAGGTHP